MPTEKPLTISASSLTLYKECKRCFWLQIKQKKRRPSGPFPALPGGIDRVLKEYFDTYREKGLPPELTGKLEARLYPNQEELNRWRAWQRGLAYYDQQKNAQFVSAIDDLLVDKDGNYIPLDFKSKGSAVKQGAEEFNRLQINSYAMLLNENHLPSSGRGILLYLWPKEVLRNWVIPFEVEVREIKTDPESAKRLFYEAVDFLNGPKPAHVESCQFCQWNLME